MWDSAFTVCVRQSSLICQFEHSGKVRSGLDLENLIFTAIRFFTSLRERHKREKSEETN